MFFWPRVFGLRGFRLRVFRLMGLWLSVFGLLGLAKLRKPQVLGVKAPSEILVQGQAVEG